MESLTRRQSQILKFIQRTMEKTGMPPTRAEIAAHYGFSSVNAAEQHLRALERKGAIELLSEVSRGIRLKLETGLPVVGRVAAGSPMLAEEHIDDYLQVNPRAFQRKAHYFLRVSGMSMRDAGIHDGDLVAVHRTADVGQGKIAVVRVDDEVTVKRLRTRGANVWLYPENPDFEPLRVNTRRHDVVIEGLVVGVMRLDAA